MGFFLPNNIKIKGIFVQNAPNSYQTDITPVEMQRGKTCVSKGKVLTGTGRAFEFAEYGLQKVDLLTVSEGVERYGIEFDIGAGANVILISPTKGDTFLQTKHLVTLLEGKPIEIGQNLSTGGKIYAVQIEGRLKIYFTEIQDDESRLRFFIGKDNEL